MKSPHPSPDDPSRSIPLVEEHVQVSTERESLGAVRVSVRQQQTVEQLELPVRLEEVDVERVPVNREVPEARPAWREGDVLVVPVYEEVLVVEKRLVLREELRLRTRVHTETVRHEVPLRRDTAVVERVATDDGDRPGGSGPSAGGPQPSPGHKE